MRLPVSLKAFAVFASLAATTAALGAATYLGLADLRRASRRIDTAQQFQIQVGRLSLFNRARTLRQGPSTQDAFADSYARAERLAGELVGLVPILPARLAPRVASLTEHLGYVRSAFAELFEKYRTGEDLKAAADAAHEAMFHLGAAGAGRPNLGLLPVVHRLIGLHRQVVESGDPAGTRKMKELTDEELRRPGVDPRFARLAEQLTLLTEESYLNLLAVRDRERFLEDTTKSFNQVAEEIVEAISRASRTRQRQVTGTVAGTVAFAGLLTLALWGGAMRYIRSFLRHFGEAVAAIRTGHYDYPEPRVPKDETGEALLFLRDLARSLGESLERVRESEERYRALAEDISDWVWETDAEGRFVYSSPVAEKLLGLHPADLIGRAPEELLVAGEAARFGPILRRSLEAAEAVASLEAAFAGADGSAVVLEASWQPVFEADGRLRGLRGISRDVTARKRAEEEQGLLRAQLLQAQKLEAIGTLTGGIAHDFNNLLQSISGYTEMLLRNKAEGDPDLPKLRTVEKAAQRAAELTRQLLVFGRRVESSVTTLDLNSEVAQVCTLLERTIPKMISVTTRLSPGLRRVQADAVQLEQVLVNLAVNAKDAMPDGGTLEFVTENVDGGEAGDLPPGRWVGLTVRDTGLGMDEETREHIFEPFFTTKDVGKGTGLGLAIVYGIVQAHRGHIRCESAPGRGTAFRLLLPAADDSASSPTAAASEPRGPGGSETVLLVDDDPGLLDLGAEILSDAGYTVLTAPSGEAALELLAEGRPVGLVVLDLNMPGMGGLECLRRARAAGHATPVAVASGYPPGELRPELERLGVRVTLRKPFRASEFLKAVRDALDRSAVSAVRREAPTPHS